MGLSYLGGKAWAEITREERFFCLELFNHVRANPSPFLALLTPQLTAPLPMGPWDIAYEACFYRDLLKDRRQSAREQRFSAKRTFDLCLMSERDLIIVEAKAQQGFDEAQCAVFASDRNAIARLLGSEVNVHLVAIASSRCPTAKVRSLDPSGVFDVWLNWHDLATTYASSVLLRADRVYRC